MEQPPYKIEQNTKEKCKASHDGLHRQIEQMGSVTGYICKCCNKEIYELCQVCNKSKKEGIWNSYYHTHEECL